ncbi:MAG: twin-arginine translocation signal domain-containing protein, partial [Cytophagaceae bacterium]
MNDKKRAASSTTPEGNSRRSFLKTLGLAGTAVATAPAQA